MTGTPSLVVLVIVPTLSLVFSLVHFVATLGLAKRHGLKVTEVGWSILRGYTAKFLEDEERLPDAEC